MKQIELTDEQLWALKIVFSRIFNAIEYRGDYYIVNTKKFFLAVDPNMYCSLNEILEKL
jgi:hypothetical protein